MILALRPIEPFQDWSSPSWREARSSILYNYAASEDAQSARSFLQIWVNEWNKFNTSLAVHVTGNSGKKCCVMRHMLCSVDNAPFHRRTSLFFLHVVDHVKVRSRTATNIGSNKHSAGRHQNGQENCQVFYLLGSSWFTLARILIWLHALQITRSTNTSKYSNCNFAKAQWVVNKVTCRSGSLPSYY
jgi:hypothetical protein